MAIVVVESGESGLHQWRRVTRNLREDALTLFGRDPEPVVAIGVKTDSDSTRSSAADYDDICLEPEPSPTVVKGPMRP